MTTATVGTLESAIPSDAGHEYSTVSTIRDDKDTETTRYLCAAAHRDGRFRNWVMEHLIEDEYRAIGESYGVDVPTVIRHCLAARHRETMQNARLTLLLAVLVAAISTALTNAGTLLQSVGADLSFDNYILAFQYLSWPIWWGAILFIIAWAVVFASQWTRRYRVLARYLVKGRFNPADRIYKSNARLRKILDAIGEQQNGNVVVYSGFSPFVGAGVSIGGWSFALDVHKGKEIPGTDTRLAPSTFQTSELYQYVTGAVEKLGLERLTTQDKIFVNGQDIRNDSRFLRDPFSRPCAHVDPEVIAQIAYGPSTHVRHYRRLQIPSWNREIALSIFLRFYQVGHNLFAEASYHLLTPLDKAYYKIDSLDPTPRGRHILGMLLGSWLMTPFVWIWSPFFIWSRINDSLARSRRRRAAKQAIRENPAFDYGATTSLRAYASADHYRQYFQKLDTEMYYKIIERQILDSLADFLDTNNIDISDLRERQLTIMNSGVIVQGGSTISGDNLALGSGARANQATRLAERAAKTVTRATQATGGS